VQGWGKERKSTKMMPTSASTTQAGEECRIAPVSTLILREGSHKPLSFPQMPYV